MLKGQQFSKSQVVEGVGMQELRGRNYPRERGIVRYPHRWVETETAQRSEQWLSDVTFEFLPNLLHRDEPDEKTELN